MQIDLHCFTCLLKKKIMLDVICRAPHAQPNLSAARIACPEGQSNERVTNAVKMPGAPARLACTRMGSEFAGGEFKGLLSNSTDSESVDYAARSDCCAHLVLPALHSGCTEKEERRFEFSY